MSVSTTRSLPGAGAAKGGGEAVRTVSLTITGMSCGACANRVQRTLNKLDSVEATVNYATGRARASLGSGVEVDSLVRAVAKAGYGAEPVLPREPSPPDLEGRRVKQLWPRLAVAMLLCAPLGDLSFEFVLAPELRFPGWQWLLVAMTLPVAPGVPGLSTWRPFATHGTGPPPWIPWCRWA